jgi:hypothetical protein
MDSNESTVVSGIYDDYNQTQLELFQIETRKTKFKLFAISAVIFGFGFIAIAILNLMSLQNILSIMIVPAIIAALAWLSTKEALLAMILAAVVIVGVLIYSISLYGAAGLYKGLIEKAILVYLFIAGFQSAREAQRIRKELKL